MQNMPAPIIEPMANAAGKLAVAHVQVRSQGRALRTAPVGLRPAVDAVLADDLELLLDAVDDNGDSLSRDPSVRRAGYPRGLLEEMFAGAWAA